MKIKQMTATFGGLHQKTLTPAEGLTVSSAPTEAGKSTWASFVKAMLYGIDTRERDKNGVLADKNRYQPWSGAPMWGELQLEWEGRKITLRRTTNRSGPMQGFEAVYTATGDPVPEFTAANAGQMLLGAGKEVFVRSALVGQNSTVVTNNAELESRIAALATSGQEDVSYSAVERMLKDWKNRRRLNRSNGRIPELERELARVEVTLDEVTLARDHKVQAEEQLKLLEEERRELTSDMEIHRRLSQKALNRRLGEAMEQLAAAQMKLEELPAPDPVYAGLSARQARELEDRLKAETAQQAEERRRQQEEAGEAGSLRHRRSIIKNFFKGTVPLLGFGGLALVIIGFVIRLYALSYIGFGCMAAAVCLSIVFVLLLGGIDPKLGKLAETAPVPEPDPVPDVEEYLQHLGQKELLEQEIRHGTQRVDDLKAQGAREFDTLEMLHTPARSAAETAARLSAVEGEMARWQTQLDRAIGALKADPLILEARRDELLAEIEERTCQYDALELALKGMEKANGILRERFSPALNQEAARIFSRLTGGKYHQLSLSRDLSAVAGAEGDPEGHGAPWLSAGTVDQLYLAVRLAVCNLTLPGAPILLDDALAAFDDNRAQLALDCLKELAAERQILLFTCHSRESRWAEENNVPVISI